MSALEPSFPGLVKAAVDGERGVRLRSRRDRPGVSAVGAGLVAGESCSRPRDPLASPPEFEFEIATSACFVPALAAPQQDETADLCRRTARDGDTTDRGTAPPPPS